MTFWHILLNASYVLAALVFCMLLAAFYEWAKPETYLEKLTVPFVCLYALGRLICEKLAKVYRREKAQHTISYEDIYGDDRL
jgi:prolipoprotein diacylglyceryltransferase